LEPASAAPPDPPLPFSTLLECRPLRPTLSQIPEGARVDVPLWLLPELARRGFIAPRLPASHGAALLDDIEAVHGGVTAGVPGEEGLRRPPGATAFDLRSRGAHWYSMAERLARVGRESVQRGNEPFWRARLGEAALRVFRLRHRDLLAPLGWGDGAAGAAGGGADASGAADLAGLTNEERELYALAAGARAARDAWARGEAVTGEAGGLGSGVPAIASRVARLPEKRRRAEG